MDQPLVIGLVMLAAFGLVGALLGFLWSQRPFQISAWLLAGAVMIALIGVRLVVAETERLEHYTALRDWATTQGTIIASRVIGVRAFRPEIVYQYQVESSVFTDSTSLDPPSFGGRNSKRDAAEGVASEYPVGKAVTIHFNPKDPSDSRLKITAPWSVYGQLGFGAFLFGAGALLIAGRIRKR